MFTPEVIIQRLFLTIVLGALVGIERDGHLKVGDGKKSKRQEKSVGSSQAQKKFSFIVSSTPAGGLGGFRTYILIAILGAVSGIAFAYGVAAITWLIGGGMVAFILVSFILNYFDKNTFGLTTEISILLTYTLSMLMFASNLDLRIIVAVSVFNAFILSIKSESRALVSKFSLEEIVDTFKFVLITVVILQFLPNVEYFLSDNPTVGSFFVDRFGETMVDSVAVINPYRTWLVVVLVSGVNFVGYFLVKLLGRKQGVNILGLLGGLVSSTVVTETMAAASKSTKDIQIKNSLFQATMLANMTSFIRIIVVAGLVNFTLATKIAPSMLVMSVSVFIWFYLVGALPNKKIKPHKVTEKDQDTKKRLQELGLSFKSPFSIKPALTFGALYLFISIFTKGALYYLGNSGFLVSAMISSISGLDAVTVTTASVAGNQVEYGLAATVLLVAASTNLVIKSVFAAIMGDSYFKKKVFIAFISTIVVGIGVLILTL